MATEQKRSMLVIAAGSEVADAIVNAFSGEHDLRIDTKDTTLAQMNGKAIRAMADYDVIMFQASPDDSSDIEAIQTLVSNRSNETTLVALADGDISLSKARALSNAGVDEVLPLPKGDGEIDAQMLRLSRKKAARHSGGAVHQGCLIAVAQARGGVGSTTVAVNLADQLCLGKGRFSRGTKPKVALVDLDLQFGTIGSFLDLGEQDALLQLAMDGKVPDATFLTQSMVDLPSGLSVLAAPSSFAPLDSLRSDQVAAIIDTLRESYDFVVVDMPRALVGWIEPIVQRADEMMVVTDMSVSSVRHCRRLIDFFTQDNLSLPVQVVVNHQHKPLMQTRLHREAAKVLDRKLEHWLPHDPRAACGAADRGKPLSVAAPRSPLGKAMSRLARATLSGRQLATQQAAK
ncbi:AAA family ATPase [Defluviimonas aestuarii]|uniref:AAA family ATPase n=1 Tax=Albidovulum aestuarii TaxID=1130726 RepID=UPI00249B63A4|nr:AAA family ATPase [Defluviimonas aestuarii]MDI3334887.1 AAA family ATPase [Defluviimonas aestuarii]